MKRTVLVTGANSGIGLETALELSAAGFDVVGTARSDEAAGVLEAAALEAGVGVRTEILDVTDRAACRRLVDRLELYALVNNAGYMNVGALEDVPPEDALRQFEAVVLAPVHLATLALPGMRRRGVGRILNITSVAAHVTGPLIGWYAACKHAVDALSDALRAEAAPFAVEVIVVEPGAFRTGIWQKAANDLRARRNGSVHADEYDRVLDYLPSFEARVPHPRKVAETIAAALTAGKPEHRYQVGADAPLLTFANFVTPPHAKDRLRELMIRTLPKLPRRSPGTHPAPLPTTDGPN